MHATIVAVILASGLPQQHAGEHSVATVAAALAPQLQTGTLLFTKGDCLAIKTSGGGPYTHVGAVVLRDGIPIVYDSMNGSGVRELSLEEYLASQAPDEIDVLQPCGSFSPRQAQKFEAALQSRLGTEYSVLHYVIGRRSEEGVHCSEYVTDALIAAGKIRARHPPRVSPSSLAEGLLEGQVYAADECVRFPLEPEAVESDNWCEQLWLDTKQCCLLCCDKFSGWFLCR